MRRLRLLLSHVKPMGINTKLHLHIYGLIVLAIVTASISPACAFINGSSKDFIEICSGDSTKTIPAPDNSQHHNKQADAHEQCAFCLNHFSAHALINEEFIIASSSFKMIMINGGNDSVLSIPHHEKNARAPPHSL